MIKFLLEMLFFGGFALLAWDAAYKKGRGDLWNELAHGYIVLPKGSYCIFNQKSEKVNFKKKKWSKKKERKNAK